MQPRVIDWDAIHRRLASATSAMAGNIGCGPEAAKRILEARARAAAKPPSKPDDTARLDILAFSLADETYGVESRYVREVCQLRDLTAVPCTPPFIAGVMNLHGQILAIVDLRQFFELPVRGLTELNRVIVLSRGEDELGLLADSIEGVRSVTAATLQVGLPTLTGIREKFLKGITGQRLAILDGGRLLNDTGLKGNKQVTQ